jgi:hypothetical protein
MAVKIEEPGRTWKISRTAIVTGIVVIQFSMASLTSYMALTDLTSSYISNLLEGWVLALVTGIILMGATAALILLKSRSHVAGQLALTGSIASLFVMLDLAFLQERDDSRYTELPHLKSMAGWIVLSMLLWSVRVFVRRKHSKRLLAHLLLVSSLGSLVVGFVLTFLQARTVDQQQAVPYWWHMHLWVVISTLCGWCVYTLLRAGVSLPHIGKVATAASISTVLSILNFLYPNVYRPAAAPYQLNIAIEFSKPVLNPKGSVAAVPVTFIMKNTSDVRVYVVGSSYTVMGRRAKYLPRRNLDSGLVGGCLSRSGAGRISSYFRSL